MSAAAEIRDAEQGAPAVPARRPRPEDFDPSPPHAILFWALMFFFFLEFLRPPVLSQLKYQMLFVSLVPILWLTSKDRPWSPILTMQWLMLGQAAISIVYGVNYFAAYTGARTMWPNVVSGLAIFWILSREKNFVRGIWVWALIISYQAFFAFSIGGGHGSGGILGDENDLAMACTMAVPFMLMSMQLLRGLSRALALGLLVLLLVGIVASESRGGFVGLAGAVAYCLFYSANRARNFAIIALGGLIFFFSIPSEYKDELGSISETKSGTAEARFFLWTAGTNMWIDNPVLGVGALNSPWLIGDYQPKAEDNGGMFSDRGYRERDWTMTPMHSIYFEILSETGLVGIGLFGTCVWLHFSVIGENAQENPALAGRGSGSQKRRGALRRFAGGCDDRVPGLRALSVDSLLPVLLLLHGPCGGLRCHDHASPEFRRGAGRMGPGPAARSRRGRNRSGRPFASRRGRRGRPATGPARTGLGANRTRGVGSAWAKQAARALRRGAAA